MRDRIRVGVVGPGAVGATVAASLARAGAEVILAGPDPGWTRAARREGLRWTDASPGRSADTRPRGIRYAYRPPGPACAAVFICVKAPAVAAAFRQARGLVGPETAVVSLVNGLTAAPRLRRAFGAARCVCGAAYFAADRPSRLHARLQGGDRIELARTRANAAAAGLAARLLRSAGWRVVASGDEDRLLWTKAVFNAAVNPLGALTARANGELAGRPPLRDLLLRALGEAQAAARAAGRAPLPRRLDRVLLANLRGAPEQRNSMLQDLSEGRRTEADDIVLPLLREARRRRVPTPTLDPLYRLVKRLERELAR